MLSNSYLGIENNFYKNSHFHPYAYPNYPPLSQTPILQSSLSKAEAQRTLSLKLKLKIYFILFTFDWQILDHWKNNPQQQGTQ